MTKKSATVLGAKSGLIDCLPPGTFVRLKVLLTILPFSAATLWRKVKAGAFPKPYKLSDRVTAWRADEVRDWISLKGIELATLPCGVAEGAQRSAEGAEGAHF